MARRNNKKDEKGGPSVNVPIGNDRVTRKLFREENGLIGSLKTLFGTEATLNPQRTQNTTTYHVILKKASTDKQKQAKLGLSKLVESLQAEEKSILDEILSKPYAYATKVGLELMPEEIANLKGLLTNVSNALKHSYTQSEKKDKNPEAEKPINKLRGSIDHHRAAYDKNSKKKKATAPTEATAVKAMLENIVSEAPDMSGFTPSYAGKVMSACDMLNQHIMGLEKRIQKHDAELAIKTTEAEQEFSSEEREELRVTIENALEEKHAKLEDREKKLLLNSAYRAITAVELSKEDIRTTLRSVIPVTPQERQQLELEQKQLLEREALQQYALYGGKFVPRNQHQVEQIKAMRENGKTIVVGGAGTGKSIVSMAYALDRHKEDPERKIIIFRPMVELGEGQTMGFLPGGELEKIGPLFRPILKNALIIEPNKMQLKKWLGLAKEQGEGAASFLDTLVPTHVMQLTPMAYVRGDTFTKCTIIVEEAQNLRLFEAEALMTRLGPDSEIILAGDKIQTDMKLKDRQGNWLDEKQMPALPILIHMAQKGRKGLGLKIYPDEAITRSEDTKDSVELFKAIRENAHEIYAAVFEGYGEDSIIKFTNQNGNGHSKNGQNGKGVQPHPTVQ